MKTGARRRSIARRGKFIELRRRSDRDLQHLVGQGQLRSSGKLEKASTSSTRSSRFSMRRHGVIRLRRSPPQTDDADDDAAGAEDRRGTTALPESPAVAGRVTTIGRSGRCAERRSPTISPATSRPARRCCWSARPKQLMGKSFIEVMRILVPDPCRAGGHRHRARLRYSICRSSGCRPLRMTRAGAEATNGVADGAETAAIRRSSRALKRWHLLEQVGAYFRAAEPSSPMPFLTERARDLAERDFLSLLEGASSCGYPSS